MIISLLGSVILPLQYRAQSFSDFLAPTLVVILVHFCLCFYVLIGRITDKFGQQWACHGIDRNRAAKVAVDY